MIFHTSQSAWVPRVGVAAGASPVTQLTSSHTGTTSSVPVKPSNTTPAEVDDADGETFPGERGSPAKFKRKKKGVSICRCYRLQAYSSIERCTAGVHWMESGRNPLWVWLATPAVEELQGRTYMPPSSRFQPQNMLGVNGRRNSSVDFHVNRTIVRQAKHQPLPSSAATPPRYEGLKEGTFR
jgi:hypothetical protein